MSARVAPRESTGIRKPTDLLAIVRRPSTVLLVHGVLIIRMVTLMITTTIIIVIIMTLFHSIYIYIHVYKWLLHQSLIADASEVIFVTRKHAIFTAVFYNRWGNLY